MFLVMQNVCIAGLHGPESLLHHSAGFCHTPGDQEVAVILFPMGGVAGGAQDAPYTDTVGCIFI